jgi:glycosyltransferase involved in cell wall biosynthesis
MRTAIIHPWFLFRGGGERVTEVLAAMYPEADIYSIFADQRFIPGQIQQHQLKTSFLNEIPGGKRLYRQLLPLHPLAAESLDLSGYDLVISSDYSVAKGVLVDQEAVHISYCHTPTRYLWDHYHGSYQRQSPLLRPLFALTCHYARTWDYVAAQRVDAFVANSEYIADRIQQYYRRESAVIYPPIETSKAYLRENTDDYYLSVGRLSSSKRLDLVIEACNRLGRRLLIAGVGREENKLKTLAGKTIEFLGRVPDSALGDLYARCRAFIFAADEDFGMVSVEAQAYGRPVIAYAHGGSLETVRGYGQHPEPTGVFFTQQTSGAVADAILDFECVEEQFHSAAIRAHSLGFDTSVFIERMKAFVDSTLLTCRNKSKTRRATHELARAQEI